jgi:uncharacterized protein
MKQSVLRLILLSSLPLATGACNVDGTASSAKSADASNSCQPGAKLGSSDAGLELLRLCIKSAGKTRSFKVENAADPEQQARGLMFRTSLADDAGMIFPFALPRPASFWMKNTVIPLDIIFIDTNGRIESIAENTVPYSLDPVKSQGDAKAVLELRGGLTKELGIKAGDAVSW